MKQTLSLSLAIIVGASIIAGALYFALRPATSSNQPTRPIKENNERRTTIVPPSSPVPLPSPTPSSNPLTWTKDDIIQALHEKTGIKKDKIQFSLAEQKKQKNKILLQGAVSEIGAMGGAGFFAVVDQNGVHVTYAGQGVPDCEEVEPYGYPTSWADYCIDSHNQTVKR